MQVSPSAESPPYCSQYFHAGSTHLPPKQRESFLFWKLHKLVREIYANNVDMTLTAQMKAWWIYWRRIQFFFVWGIGRTLGRGPHWSSCLGNDLAFTGRGRTTRSHAKANMRNRPKYRWLSLAVGSTCEEQTKVQVIQLGCREHLWGMDQTTARL